MRTVFKWLFRLTALAVLLVVVLVLGRNVLLRELLERQIRTQTGMETRIGYLHLGLFTPALRVEDVKVYYPADIGRVTLLEVAELYLEVDRGALWRGHLRIPRARLNLSQVNVVAGHFGLPSPARASRAPTASPSSPAPAQTPSRLVFDSVDLLELSLGRVQFSSLTGTPPPRDIPVDLKQTLTHLKSWSDLTWQVLPALLAKGLVPLTNGPALK